MTIQHDDATADNYPTADRHRVRRIAERARYDRATVHAILDAGYFCQIGFVANGKPVVIPMTYWREGEYVYLHSANKGRFADACANGDICLSVTHFDGLVLGHSAMNHSFNFRSVVLHGRAEIISGHDEKTLAMRSFVEQIIPGRWDALRPVRDHEIRAITLMRLPLDQVAAKVRDEYPDEETIDPDWPVWVGIIPSTTEFGTPVQDPERNTALPTPAHVRQYRGRDKRVAASK